MRNKIILRAIIIIFVRVAAAVTVLQFFGFEYYEALSILIAGWLMLYGWDTFGWNIIYKDIQGE